tara:strand:- start:6833 stop:7126 length:294 start_codon:yes stop_codon:yes gene_type:complete
LKNIFEIHHESPLVLIIAEFSSESNCNSFCDSFILSSQSPPLLPEQEIFNIINKIKMIFFLIVVDLKLYFLDGGSKKRLHQINANRSGSIDLFKDLQ